MATERFHKAARDGILDVLKETTRRDCNMKDDDGMTPTMWAAFEGNLEALRLLVARGGDPDKSDNYGNTALHYAAERGHMSCVTFLANFGANLWSLNFEMHTPKELAAINNRDEILRFLDEAMAKQETTNRKEVKAKKEKAQKEAEKKIKEYDKVKKKAEKYAEREQKRLEKEREKMGEDFISNQGTPHRPSTVLMALKNKTGVGSGTLRQNNAQSPRFSEIVGTVNAANAKRFGIGGVQKKIQQKKFGTQRGDPVPNGGDFKVVEIEDGKKSVRNLTGLRRDSEILYVGTYEKDEQSTGKRGKLADVFETKEGILESDVIDNEDDGFGDEVLLQEPASIFDRPGFGSFAFRNSITATLSALPVVVDENGEIKESKGDESSIGSAGSLAKRQSAKNGDSHSPWNVDVNSEDDEDDDDDSLGDDEWSPLQLFLVANGLGEYMGRFVAEKIDLESLSLLTDDDLKELGLPLGPRRKLMTAMEKRKKALQEPGQVQDSQL